MDHANIDQVSLALARRVAERLRRQPGLIDLARANLERWSRQNASAASLLRCYAEWQNILSRPVEDICELLCPKRKRRSGSGKILHLPASSHRRKSGPLKRPCAMRRQQLEHIIRAAAGITGATEFVILGSQAVLGQFPQAPDELLVSIEADVFSLRDPADSDLIDGSIGDLTKMKAHYPGWDITKTLDDVFNEIYEGDNQ